MFGRLKYQFGILFLIIIIGCVEQFTPPVSNYENLLVVEAFISDKPSSHYVKLSRSYPIDTTLAIAESGAGVSVFDSNGNQFDFIEQEAGSYYSDSLLFTPILGETYILSITTRDGRIYKSDPVVMIETPPIEDIFYKIETVTSNEVGGGGLDNGLQIYLNAGRATSETSYFKFEWEETWEFQTPFESFLDWDYQNNREFLREENISICWNGSISTDINLATTENITSGLIEGHPIRFIPFRESTLRIKYSILVKQFSMSEAAYRFWENLKESNESTGSLYDAQPFQVSGNLKNTEDPLEPVLGYFDMATVSTKRIFIKRSNDIPLEIWIPSLFPQCLVGADTTAAPDNVLTFLNNGYLIETYAFPPGSGFTMATIPCMDCRLKGSNVKPDFWQ